jgi:hypothetical protein
MKKVLLYLILIMAVGMAGTAAFVSVTGLMKIFAGAGTAGLIFFIGIEAAKVVATSAIHTYGKRIGWFYNILLSLGIVIAMAITSMGIYGFLSSSYKESFSKMENVETQIELLEKKRDGYQLQLDLVNDEKASVTQTITELSKGLSNNVIQYKDPETGEIITTTSSSTRRALEKQLDKATERQEVLNGKSDDLSDKVFDLENEITDVKLGDDSSSELSSLKYLSDVTGMSMDDVMKYFILLLIVIGDPMAVIMVIVFNKVVNHGKKDDDAESDAVNEVVNDAPKKPLINPESGNVDLSGPQLPMPYTDDTPSNVIDTKEIWDTVKDLRERGILTKPSDEDLDEPTALANSGLTELEPIEEEEPKHKPLPDQKPKIIEPEFEVPEEVPVTEVKSDKITIDDIKEVKERERGFSVTIPTRKKKGNTVDRIGSNKEVRNGDKDTVYFKRR